LDIKVLSILWGGFMIPFGTKELHHKKKGLWNEYRRWWGELEHALEEIHKLIFLKWMTLWMFQCTQQQQQQQHMRMLSKSLCLFCTY
jgi:hypothetical protein